MTTAMIQDFVARQPHINQRRRILRPMLRAVGSLFCRVETSGLERIPNTGPVILMINHISFIDPIVFTAVITNRYVISMAKAEAAEHWLYRQVVKLWGNFVINREEVDREALNNTIDLLKTDNLVLMAVEGTRNPQGLQAPKSGVAYVAHKANAIVVPAAINGAETWSKKLGRLRRAYAQVSIGRPFRFALPEGQRLSRTIRETMITEAMYQLALTMPDEYAGQRGMFQDVQHATTDYIDFV